MILNNMVQKMISLGKLTRDTEAAFYETFGELPGEFTLQEAEALLEIFQENDMNDYCGLAWDLVLKLESVRGLSTSTRVQQSKAYWVKMILREAL